MSRRRHWVQVALVTISFVACGKAGVEADDLGGKPSADEDGGAGTPDRSATSSTSSSGQVGTTSSSSGTVDVDATPSVDDPCALSLGDFACEPNDPSFRCAGGAMAPSTDAGAHHVSLTRRAAERSALWAHTNLSRATRYVLDFELVVASDPGKVGDGFAIAFVEAAAFPGASPSAPNAPTLGVTKLENATGHAAYWRTTDSATSSLGDFILGTTVIPVTAGDGRPDGWNEGASSTPPFNATSGARVHVHVVHDAGAANARVSFASYQAQENTFIDVGSVTIDVPEVTQYVGVGASTGYKGEESEEAVTQFQIACPAP